MLLYNDLQFIIVCIFCLFLVGPPFTLHFRVRFYAAEPQDLSEELTRYLLIANIVKPSLDGCCSVR